MASSYSTNLAIELPALGDQDGTWGTTVNTNLGTLIEQAISGYTTQAITDGADTTITIPNGASGVARNMFIECTGALTAQRNLIVPANKKLYFIYNNTTGGYSVTVKVSGQTGVTVPNSFKMLLVCNGTDIVDATTNFSSLSVAGVAVTTSSNSQTLTNKSMSWGQLTGTPTTLSGYGVTMSTARMLGRTTASTGAVEEISVGTGLALSAGSLASSLSYYTNSLNADVPLNSVGAFIAGPTVTQGTSGTWFASGTVTLTDTAGPALIYVKLWDGATLIASTALNIGAATALVPVTLSGLIVAPAGNIRISARDVTSTSGAFLYSDGTGNNKNSTLTAIRIA